MRNAQELIILVGNIGCGKSTLARKYARKGYIIMNGDGLLTSIQGGIYGLYNPDMKPVHDEIEQEVIVSALVGGFSVVVDKTNMTKKVRKMYFDIVRYVIHQITMNRITVRAIDWGPGYQYTLNRRLDNPGGIKKSVWVNVHEQMKHDYEKPSLKEGFDEVQPAPDAYTFRAYDFDGTIVSNAFPHIGTVNQAIVDDMRTFYKSDKNMIIIWTCRSGDYLAQAEGFLLDNNIPFDYINENPLAEYGSRKVFAHKYVDDRNCFYLHSMLQGD